MEINLITENEEINNTIDIILDKYRDSIFIESLSLYLLKKNGVTIDTNLKTLCQLNQLFFNLLLIFMGIPSLKIISKNDKIYENESLLQLSMLIIINRLSIMYHKLVIDVLGENSSYISLVKEIENYDWDNTNYDYIIRIVIKNIIKGLKLLINNKVGMDIDDLSDDNLNNLINYFNENNNNFESLTL